MPAGRPKIFDAEDITKKVDVYLDQCRDEEDEFHKTRGDKSDSYERILKVDLPTRYGFCSWYGISINRLDELSKKFDKLYEALKKIDEEQKKRLLNEGLANNYNSTIAKLILSANHGISEKTEIDHTTKGEKLESTTIINSTDEQLNKALSDRLTQE